MIASKSIKKYFSTLKKDVDKINSIANKARSKNFDPEPKVEIMLAETMAQRVIGLVSTIEPKLLETKIPQRIRELEKIYGILDWRVGLIIAEEIAKENFCKFKDKQEAMEIGIRTGFAYLTLGIVAAPLEGFIGLNIKQRKDGKEYLALRYAGPIRGAGGTASSISVILSDYVRVKMGYEKYDPTEKEISRYITEVNDYHERVTNLQYRPSDEEIKFMVSNLSVEVTGDPTERLEVSNYKGLPRIPTDLIRGGMCLVVAEGLCQKAPKLWKRLFKWGKEMSLEWDFIKEFLDLKEKIHAQHSNENNKKEDNKDEEIEETVKSNNTFIMDIVAGRPVLTDPLAHGGFRLRYGRSRASGFSAAACHPATLGVLEDYIAIGTQLKVERPGKAATITVCDSIEGPTVLLKNGSVIKIKSEEVAKKYTHDVKEVLFLGDILFNYGDFSENGQKLVPCGYCPEWWALEVEEKINKRITESKETIEQIKNKINLEQDLSNILKNPLKIVPSWDDAIKISQEFNIPLHPEYTHFWNLISYDDFLLFLEYFKKTKVKKDSNDNIVKLILPYNSSDELCLKTKRILELVGIPHEIISSESIVINEKESKILTFFLKGISNKLSQNNDSKKYKTALQFFNNNSLIQMRDKAGTFVGARMGRPEKAKMRHLKGSPHGLFPVGEEGDRLKSFQSALKGGYVTSYFPLFYCENCKLEMIYGHCVECGKKCIQKYFCRFCGVIDKDTCRHGKANKHKHQKIDLGYYFSKAKESLGETLHPDLIKGVKGTSNKDKIVEHLSKAILRAKHNINVNKDGTTRYDMTELPLTHFKPKEIKTDIKKLQSLGYNADIYGEELIDENQLLELKPQDIILPGFDSLEESSSKVFLRVAQFIDELLVKLYKIKPFYKVKNEEDLIGHLVIGLAPHISAGMVGRIIGFSQTQGMLTHPMYHAGLRRDCDGDEAAAMLLLDGLLNFSKKYLPSSRGSTMDAPLVLTSIINPAEVDDQVLGVDVEWKYPLEFYRAAMKMKAPWEVKYGPDNKKIEQLAHRLGKENQYEDFGFTHSITNFNQGIQCSAYKTLPTMKLKLFGQMEIARKVRAVNMDNVARLVIQKHFLRDIKGNLKKYSMQKFRCSSCNTKYRRPPISGKCTECNKGKLMFTISEGSVVKYLDPSLDLAKEYDFSPYLKETINLLKTNVLTVFGKGRDKQMGLGNFMAKE
jgi:DNA polymerase II large subunit